MKRIADSNQENKPATPDVLWKKLIKKFFKEFVRTFKSELGEKIIYEKTEFLDKELLSITIRVISGGYPLNH